MAATMRADTLHSHISLLDGNTVLRATQWIAPKIMATRASRRKEWKKDADVDHNNGTELDEAGS
jgi:hypothetical protein